MRLLPKLLLATAWGVVCTAFGLLVLEESGVLVELARVRLAGRLGSLGPGLSIEHVALRWFEPGVVLEGVTLRSPTARGEEPGDVRLHLPSIHVALSLEGHGGWPVAEVRVGGGRVRISEAFLEELGTAFEEVPVSERGAGTLEPPPFVLTDFDAELELFDGSVLDLGQVSLVAQPAAGGGYRLHGRIVPTLGGAVPVPDAIFVDGQQTLTGLSLNASASGLSLESRSFQAPETLEALPVESFAGELNLDGTARLDWGGDGVRLDGSLRAAVRRGRVALRDARPPLTDLEGDVDVRFDFPSGARLWDREAWSAATRLQGRWLDAPLTAWAVWGSQLPPRDWARLWVYTPALPLREELLDYLGVPERNRRVWHSLGPRGTAATTMDMRLSAPRETPEGLTLERPDVAVELLVDGQAGMTYHGIPAPDGRLQGIPVPFDQVQGLIFGSFDRGDGRVRCGLAELSGDHGSGRASAAGYMRSPPLPLEPWDFELSVSVPEIQLDERVRQGLAGHWGTERIWSTYQPLGGTLAVEWRMHSSAETNGLTAAGDVRVRDSNLLWEGLPIPFGGASGELALRWERRGSTVAGHPLRRARPLGLTYRFSNVGSGDGGPETSRGGARGTVTGSFRQEPIDPGPVVLEELPIRATQELEILFEDLLLRGRDWDVLSVRFPAIGEQAQELGAKGGMRVLFQGSRASPDAPYLSVAEASPNVVEISPRVFQRRTRDLRGRLLLRTQEQEPDQPPLVEADLALAGQWPGGVELAARSHSSSREVGRLEVLGAGIDPSNTAFKGALVAMLSEAGRARDLPEEADPALDGRIDLAVTAELVPDQEPQSRARIYLRDNGMRSDSLRLERLHGTLDQNEDVLESARIAASLAGHPVEMRDVLVFREGAAPPHADPVVERETFGPVGEFVLQADLHVVDLPLDEEHLSHVIDREKLSLLSESAVWRGRVDLQGTRIVVGSDKLFVRGTVEPHELSMRLGIPITVERAEFQVEELVFEGERIRGWGRIEGLDAEILTRALSDARMILTYVDGRLSIDNLAGDFEGGRLESMGGQGRGTRKALSIGLAPPYRFDLAVRLENVLVDRLLRGVFSTSIADQGRLNVGLQLRGTPSEVLGIEGSGWINLRDAQLWSIPVMRELFGQLGFDSTAVFDRMRGRFDVADGRIESKDVTVTSSLLNLVGSGWVDLDGRLHYDLEARYGLIDRLGPLNRLLYWLNNSLWRIAVRGDMSRPHVRVRNSILEFLGSSKGTPARELPLPAQAGLPERF